MPDQSTYVYGVRGGVGTTTVTMMTALTWSRRNPDVKTLLVDNIGGDMPVYAAIPTPDNNSITVLRDNLWLYYNPELAPIPGEKLSEFGHWFIDAARQPCSLEHPASHATRVLQVIGNDYLSLRRMVDLPNPTKRVCVFDQSRALNRADIEAISEVPVLFLDLDPRIARFQDAGLFIEDRSINIVDNFIEENT